MKYVALHVRRSHLLGIAALLLLKIRRATVDGIAVPLLRAELLTLNLAAGQRAEVIVWR